jgi:hypothetical protein
MQKRWTLTAPTGETWEGDEPWLLVSRATRRRSPPPVGLRETSMQEVRRCRTERASLREHNG